MLVNRRTFIVKKPHYDEALALLAEYRGLMKRVDRTAVMRVYASEIGHFDTIACELEVASLSAFERALAKFEEHPGVAPRLSSCTSAGMRLPRQAARMSSGAWSISRCGRFCAPGIHLKHTATIRVGVASR